eukprot:3917724-Rhodomonas_salina.1
MGRNAHHRGCVLFRGVVPYCTHVYCTSMLRYCALVLHQYRQNRAVPRLSCISTVQRSAGTDDLYRAEQVLLAERPYPHVDNLADFDACLWMTIITMTTVGYGDVVAQTRMGRFVSCIVACMGACVSLSLFVS